MTDILTSSSTQVTMGGFLEDISAAIAIGVFIAVMYSIKNHYTKSFIGTLILLPPVVAMVIMMVNGSIGAGIAVAGAFSLVRFRSVPGSAREIASLFLAMSTGLACGMGQLLFAGIFAAIMGLVMLVYALAPFGNRRSTERKLMVTIPEDLDYTGVFDDLMDRYTNSSTLKIVKTTNMGSMLKLTYSLDLKKESEERDFLNEIRCRNGNLEVSMARASGEEGEL